MTRRARGLHIEIPPSLDRRGIFRRPLVRQLDVRSRRGSLLHNLRHRLEIRLLAKLDGLTLEAVFHPLADQPAHVRDERLALIETQMPEGEHRGAGHPALQGPHQVVVRWDQVRRAHQPERLEAEVSRLGIEEPRRGTGAVAVGAVTRCAQPVVKPDAQVGRHSSVIPDRRSRCDVRDILDCIDHAAARSDRRLARRHRTAAVCAAQERQQHSQQDRNERPAPETLPKLCPPASMPAPRD